MVKSSRRTLKSYSATSEGATLPAQRADTIEPGAERWRRLRRHRAALGRRRNNSQAPFGALQSEAKVRFLVSTILSIKIKILQKANIVRNTRRVGSCYAPVGALIVFGDRLPRATLHGCAASLCPRLDCAGPFGAVRVPVHAIFLAKEAKFSPRRINRRLRVLCASVFQNMRYTSPSPLPISVGCSVTLNESSSPQ